MVAKLGKLVHLCLVGRLMIYWSLMAGKYLICRLNKVSGVVNRRLGKNRRLLVG